MWKTNGLVFVIAIVLVVRSQDIPSIGSVPLAEEDTELQAAREEVLRKFFDEWMVYMKDFDPTQMLNFEIKAGERKEFYETVDEVPQILRGAYSVSATLKNKIKFTIYDPAGQPITIKDRQREAIFYIQVNTTGKYTLEFANHNYLSMEGVNFGASVVPLKGSAKKNQNLLHSESLAPSEEGMQVIEKNLNDLSIQQKFFEYRKGKQNEEVAAIGRKSLYISLAETCIVLGLTIWQVYYIKNMLDFRQSV